MDSDTFHESFVVFVYVMLCLIANVWYYRGLNVL